MNYDPGVSLDDLLDPDTWNRVVDEEISDINAQNERATDMDEVCAGVSTVLSVWLTADFLYSAFESSNSQWLQVAAGVGSLVTAGAAIGSALGFVSAMRGTGFFRQRTPRAYELADLESKKIITMFDEQPATD